MQEFLRACSQDLRKFPCEPPFVGVNDRSPPIYVVSMRKSCSINTSVIGYELLGDQARVGTDIRHLIYPLTNSIKIALSTSGRNTISGDSLTI